MSSNVYLTYKHTNVRVRGRMYIIVQIGGRLHFFDIQFHLLGGHDFFISAISRRPGLPDVRRTHRVGNTDSMHRMRRLSQRTAMTLVNNRAMGT